MGEVNLYSCVSSESHSDSKLVSNSVDEMASEVDLGAEDEARRGLYGKKRMQRVPAGPDRICALVTSIPFSSFPFRSFAPASSSPSALVREDISSTR